MRLLFLPLVLFSNPDPEAQRLAHVWRITAVESGGKKWPVEDNDLFNLKWSFRDGTAFAIVDDFFVEYGTYRLNASAKPQEINLLLGDKTFKGIYVLQAETLKACFSVRCPAGKEFAPGGEGRPKNFFTKEHPDRILFVFTLEKTMPKKEGRLPLWGSAADSRETSPCGSHCEWDEYHESWTSRRCLPNRNFPCVRAPSVAPAFADDSRINDTQT